MELLLRLEIISVFILLIIFIMYLLKKGRVSIKYSLVWIFASLVMIFFGIFPGLLVNLSSILGFEVPSNMILFVFLGLLIAICIALTVILSEQKKKTILLIQEVSILREMVEKK